MPFTQIFLHSRVLDNIHAVYVFRYTEAGLYAAVCLSESGNVVFSAGHRKHNFQHIRGLRCGLDTVSLRSQYGLSDYEGRALRAIRLHHFYFRGRHTDSTVFVFSLPETRLQRKRPFPQGKSRYSPVWIILYNGVCRRALTHFHIVVAGGAYSDDDDPQARIRSLCSGKSIQLFLCRIINFQYTHSFNIPSLMPDIILPSLPASDPAPAQTPSHYSSPVSPRRRWRARRSPCRSGRSACRRGAAPP